MRPTAILKTSPTLTRVLVRLDGDDVLKAVLRTASCSPHGQAIPRLLEAVAIWHQVRLHVVLSAREAESWFRLGLVDALYEPLDSIHYAVEMREPVRDRRRRQRIEGMGAFVDVRQLELGGTR